MDQPNDANLNNDLVHSQFTKEDNNLSNDTKCEVSEIACECHV